MSQKLLLFIETGGPGGAERVVLDLARGFLERGTEAHVLTLRTGWLTDQLKESKVNHTLLESGRKLDIGLPFRISSFMQEKGFTVLHSHLLDSNFYGAMAATLAGVKHVATEHGDVHHTQGKKLLNAKLRIIAWCGSQLTAVSRFSSDHLLAQGFPAERLTVIGNPLMPVDPATVRSKEDIRAELGVTGEDWVWTHVANFRPVKDQQTLLRGFAAARSGSSKHQILLLVGDGPERAKLEALVAELNITDGVRFIGFQSDVASYLQASDGFILSSLSEALPMSLLEAAQAGLVLVATNVGGLPEVLRPGQTGYLFPPGDAPALAAIMKEIAENPDVARALAKNVRREVLERFSIDKVLDSYAAVYERA